MASKKILVILCFLFIAFTMGCAEKQSVSLRDMNYTVPAGAYETKITTDEDNTTYVGKVVNVVFRDGSEDVILFEDGTVVPCVAAEDFVWRMEGVQKVRTWKILDEPYVANVEMANEAKK